MVEESGKLRILSVSYDEVLLRTRHLMLERAGYGVVSVVSFQAALESCEGGSFDVFLLGHSLPHSEKLQLVRAFRRACPGPVIALRRNVGEQLVATADYHIEADPEPLLKLLEDIARNEGEVAERRAAERKAIIGLEPAEAPLRLSDDELKAALEQHRAARDSLRVLCEQIKLAKEQAEDMTQAARHYIAEFELRKKARG